VRVHLEGEGWPEALRASVVDDLRAGLRRTAMDVEEVDPERSSPPRAVVTLSMDEGARVRITLRHPADAEPAGPTRTLSLDGVSEESRSWTVAVAAEELLRAHLTDAASRAVPAGSPPPGPAPEPGEALVVPPPLHTAGPEPRPNAVAARGAFEHYTGGVTQGGVDLVYRRWLHPRVMVEVAAGVRGMLPVDAPHGTVRGWMAVGEVAAGGVPLRIGPALQLEALAFLRASAVGFRGHPDTADVDGRRMTRAGADAGLRVRLAWRLADPWTLRATLRAGGALRPVRASDTGETVVAASGGLIGGALSLSLRL
jgi:hypothetical protein